MNALEGTNHYIERSATVRAAVDGMLWRIPRDEFLRLNTDGCIGTYKVCARVAGTVVRRLNGMNRRLLDALDKNPPGREMDRLKSSLMQEWSF